MIILPLASGCRVPDIPPQPSAQEYAVYGAWFEQASASLPHELTLAIDSSTLKPMQNELQFEQCLPPRMERIFETAPDATLTSTASNDWLTLSDGRTVQLRPRDAPLTFQKSTELFRLSRVAFTRMGYQAFFWVEHRTCQVGQGAVICSGGSGNLIHARKSNNVWTFEDTLCHTVLFPA